MFFHRRRYDSCTIRDDLLRSRVVDKSTKLKQVLLERLNTFEVSSDRQGNLVVRLVALLLAVDFFPNVREDRKKVHEGRRRCWTVKESPRNRWKMSLTFLNHE